jgi:predicted AlkP superfamily pyrophosphatase or phosphodiesterase
MKKNRVMESAWATALLFAGLQSGGVIAADFPTTAGVAQRPKLVVLFVVDGLPQRQVLAYRAQLAADGFARFLDRGAWLSDAHYGHAFTVTGAGHATVLSGAYSHRSGVIGNEWRDAQTGEPEYCAGDTSASYIGHPTNPLDGTSPKNLKAETLGDVLRKLNPDSKVISVSGKDRGAILPAGKTGTAYMYMSATGQFASTTYYMKEHPGWVNTFNGKKLADQYFKSQWKALLPESDYAGSVADNQPWFGPQGGALPMQYGAADDEAPGPRFYGSLLRGPFADSMTLDFARAALSGERLGADDAPDILAISLSGHDYVNHAFGAESRLSHDHVLQLDRLLDKFFKDLDQQVGKSNYLAVLTADHGFMPAVDYSATQGVSTGRISGSRTLAKINEGLAQKFGDGKWLLGYSGSSLLLDKKLLSSRGQSLDVVANEARNLLLAEPGFAAAYTRAELLDGGKAKEPLFAQLRKSWHPDVSGDVQYAIKPNWMFGTAGSGSAATHGSPYPYDTHVPILMYGPSWIKAGHLDRRAGVADIAPTLASILKVSAPSSSEGTVLPVLKSRP